MIRVPLDHRGALKRSPRAPEISGELKLHGHDQQVKLIVDTGADCTAIDQGSIRLSKKIMRKGTRNITQGVSGKWPTRVFHNKAALSLLVEDSETGEEYAVEIDLPRLEVLAKQADFSGADPTEVLGPIAPNSRRMQNKDIRRVQAVGLLGRRSFEENGLVLVFDPNGTSEIRFTKEAEAELFA